MRNHSYYKHRTLSYGAIRRLKPIKRWCTTTAKGDTVIIVRYGSRLLEIERGKTAVVVGVIDNLIPVINTIIEAVAAGELDAAIEAVQSFGNKAKKRAA